MTFYDFLMAVSTFLVGLTGICYFYQIVYLLLPLVLRPKAVGEVPRKRYAILIAARNEEAVLPHLLDSIRHQDYPAEKITTYVIADNCADRTADVAREHGARVFTRQDQSRVGKGYALNYLLEQIELAGELDTYDAFLIFDADNLLRPDYVSAMNRVCGQGYDAFCGYRNSKNYGSNWLSAGYALWYLHDSTHLNRSRMLLGTACAVNGTGFGFTRQLLKRMGGWHFFTLTEDIEFSTWCATHGVRVGYCHDAILYDEQPTSFRQSWRQRTRWVQGGVQVSVRYAGDLIRGLFKGPRTAYASFETATLSLWGYGMSLISFGTTLASIFLTERWLGLAQAIVTSLTGTYAVLFLIGLLTVVTERSRIRATGGQIVMSLFSFPLFMMSYVPIALTALFRKFQWQPIVHSVAISVDELMPR